MAFRWIFFMLAMACSKGETDERDANQAESLPIFELKVFQNQDSTFGYEILQNSHTLIHQPNIPVVSGNKGFSSYQDAQKVGQAVIEKLKNNIMPPTIEEDELKELGVWKDSFAVI